MSKNQNTNNTKLLRERTWKILFLALKIWVLAAEPPLESFLASTSTDVYNSYELKRVSEDLKQSRRIFQYMATISHNLKKTLIWIISNVSKYKKNLLM